MAIRLGPRTQTRGMPQITVFVQVHRRLAVCSCAFKLSTRFKRTSGSRSFWSIDHHGMVLSDLRAPRRLSTSVTTIPVRIDAVKATGLVQSATLEGFLKRLTCRGTEVLHERVGVLHPMEEHTWWCAIYIANDLETLNNHILVRRQCARDTR